MRPRLITLGLGLALTVSLSSCSDSPHSPAALGADGSLEARGGNGNGKGGAGGTPDAALVELGAVLYEDDALSIRGNQSCSTCHEPSQGFAAPLASVVQAGAVVEGSVPGRFGDRKPPTAAYATLSPTFSGGGKAAGGNFWDGRATGEILGNPAADQALGPFVNPNEQGLPDVACVLWIIAGAPGEYQALWAAAGGADIFSADWANAPSVCGDESLPVGEHVNVDRAGVTAAYHLVGLAIAAFEASDLVTRFGSRFDAGQLDAEEQLGEKLFSSKGKCHQCHDPQGDQPLFTDFGFHNLGVPTHPDHPTATFNAPDGNTYGFDPGLGGFTGRSADLGKFKTPTVRNVGVGAGRAFMHNGSLVSLHQVVEFYNTRDVLPVCSDPAVLADPTRWGPAPAGAGCWPPPEHGDNLDTRNMGNLGLTPEEVDAIVAFMEALSDL